MTLDREALDRLLGGPGAMRRLAEFLRVDEVYVSHHFEVTTIGVRVGDLRAMRRLSATSFRESSAGALFAATLTELAAEARGLASADRATVSAARLDVSDWTRLVPSAAEIAAAQYAQELANKVASSLGVPGDLLGVERPRSLTRFEALAEELKDI